MKAEEILFFETRQERRICLRSSIESIKKAKRGLFNSPDIFISWGVGRRRDFRDNDNEVVFKAGVGTVSLGEGCPPGGVAPVTWPTLLLYLGKPF